jgi:photosystem II stability/assembly factor-like uncharacterized protein
MGNRGNGSRCGRGWVALVLLGPWLSWMATAAPLVGETAALHWGALGLRGAGVIRLAPAAGGGGILWACTFGDGVWKSLDGGASWVQQQLAPRDGYFSVVADPVDPFTVYAHGNAGVAKSSDGGITWLLIHAGPAQALAIAPSATSVLYLAGPSGFQGAVMSRSDDGGASWKMVTSLAAPLEGPFELAVDPTDPNDVYGVAAAFHVDASPVFVRSVDGCNTWTFPGPVPDYLSNLAIDPRQPATIYAAAYLLRVVRSRDHGATWEPANAGLPATDSSGPLAFDPASGTLFVVTVSFRPRTVSKLWKSTDGGTSWSLVLERDERLVAVAADPALPGRVYASGEQTALLASGDGGLHWQVASPSLSPAAIDDLAFSGASGSLFAAAHILLPLGIEKSTDFGASWQAVNQGLTLPYESPLSIDHLVVERASTGVLYAEARDSFFASKDGGLSWQLAGLNTIGLTIDVAAGPAAAQLLGVGPSGTNLMPQSSVMQSLDGGATWSSIFTVADGVHPDKLSSLLVDFAIFAGGRAGLWKSQDGGQNWNAIGAGLPADQAIVRLRADAAHHLYAVLEPGAHQLFRSTDRGNTWTAIETGLPAGVSVTDLAADPFGTALYAGTGAGIYVSLDGGGHWTAQNDGLKDLRVTRVVADPARPGVVYAGTAGGLYVSPAPASPCQSADGVLCLAGGRFAAQVTWRTQDGAGGSGHAVPLTGGADGSGGFWFFLPESTELVVKLVDGRPVNGHYWVFGAGVSDVAYTLKLTDTVTGTHRVYTNPQGRLASFADTGAFAAASGRSAGAALAADAWKSDLASVPAPRGAANLAGDVVPDRVSRDEAAPAAGQARVPAGANLCLAASRFAVQVAWQLPGGASTPARAVPLTTDTGIFWFFRPASLELIVKILDGRSLNGHFWVFAAGLSDLAYTATVTDTLTGATKSYVHGAGSLTSMADTSF